MGSARGVFVARRFVKKKTVVLEGDDSEPWDPSDIGDVSVDYLIEAALREGRFVYDLETTKLNPRKGKIEGVAFYVPNEKYPDFQPVRAWFPFVEGTMNQTIGAELKPLRPALSREKTMNQLRKLWSLPQVIAIAHNGVFDMGWLKLQNGTEEPIEVQNLIADSMLADYMQDETQRRYGLKIRVKKIFNHTMTTYEEASGKQGVFAFALKKPLGAYAMDDCMWTYRLWKWAMDSMRRQDKPKQHKNDDWKSPLDETAPPGFYSKLERLYWKMEMKIQRIILEMETHGCNIDWEWLVEVQRKLEREKLKIIDEMRTAAGWIPNLRSPKQVSDFLYLPAEQGGLGLPTEGLDYNEDLDTYTTRDKVIAHFGKKIPVVKMLLDYRSSEVIDRSFCQKLIALAQEEGRCYSHFNQTGTKIGRLSSANPINLMNQPRDKNLVRKAFCSHRPKETNPEKRKMRFLDADYGQVELRMAAHLAKEKGMIEVYSGGSVCKKGENGSGCQTYVQFHGCKDEKKIKCKWTGNLLPGQPKLCGKCGGEAEWLMRCRHVDLHQRTSEDVGVDRNPLAKCLDGSTLLQTSIDYKTPQLLTIESLFKTACRDAESGQHSLVYDGASYEVTDGRGGRARLKSGLVRLKRPTKIVVTKRAVVVATEDHRFQVIGDFESLDPATPGYQHVAGMSLVEAQRLEKGMKLPLAEAVHPEAGTDEFHRRRDPVRVRINPFTKEVGDGPAELELNEPWAYFAGIFAGDGCASGNACTITHGHTEEYAAWRDTVRRACDAVGLPTSVSGDKRSTRIGSRVVRGYLLGLNLCKETGVSGEKTMRVPEWVLSGGPSIMWSYLAGVFDTDGTVGKKNNGTASMTTKYPEYAGQIALMLRFLGMPILVQPGFNKTYETWYYTIHVLGAGLRQFLKYCPLRFKEKAVRLQERVDTIKRECAPKDDEVLAVLDGGERTVYDFQIDNDDHLYLQGGLIGHNNLNFGLLYRMGAPKFCTYADLYDPETGEPRVEFAEGLIEKWHAAYPGISGWHQEVIEQLIKDGYIAYTILRRRRRLREEWVQAEFRAGTQAIQFMVSGSCQDIIKAAMIRIFEARNKKIETTLPAESALWDKFRFMIQVHDELVFEVPHDIEKEAVELVRTNMEAIGPLWNLRVPLVASVKVGRNWDETH
jgi:DNA polymerase I-like protein with 3'-5' exonuclease and polymerase domains